MADGLARFNGLPAREAEDALHGGFADSAWAAGVAARRPYRDFEALLAQADAEWSRLSRDAWLEAFLAHPRIGERGGDSPAQSDREQGEVARADQETLAALAKRNRDYEARFGHVFLIAAAGRGAGEILAELELRLRNDPGAELEIAAAEQRKITRLRLARLLDE